MMHKMGAMECQEMRVMQEQNSKSVPKDSVLKLFAQFYGMERVATFKKPLTARSRARVLLQHSSVLFNETNPR